MLNKLIFCVHTSPFYTILGKNNFFKSSIIHIYIYSISDFSGRFNFCLLLYKHFNFMSFLFMDRCNRKTVFCIWWWYQTNVFCYSLLNAGERVNIKRYRSLFKKRAKYQHLVSFLTWYPSIHLSIHTVKLVRVMSKGRNW